MGELAETDRGGPPDHRQLGVAFLLAQLGALATQRYTRRVAALELTPPQTGLMLAIARAEGRSQQALAAELGTAPPRLVALLDALQERGVIERRRAAGDRRNHAVFLTAPGRRLMAELAAEAAAHETEITAALAERERNQLHALLSQVAAANGLIPGVHPGYRLNQGPLP